MAEYKQVDLQIGTEAQFESKKETLPIGTIVGITDPIHKSELDSSLQTSIDSIANKLGKPSGNPTEDSLVKVSSTGSTSYQSLEELVDLSSEQIITGNKTFKKLVVFERPNGTNCISCQNILSYGTYTAYINGSGIGFGGNVDSEQINTNYALGSVANRHANSDSSGLLKLPIDIEGTFALTPNDAPTEPSVIVTGTDRTPTWKPLSEFAGGSNDLGLTQGNTQYSIVQKRIKSDGSTVTTSAYQRGTASFGGDTVAGDQSGTATDYSFAFAANENNKAIPRASAVFGRYNTAHNIGEFVCGNYADNNRDPKTVFAVGTGIDDSRRSTGFEVRTDGYCYIHNKAIATEEYVGNNAVKKMGNSYVLYANESGYKSTVIPYRFNKQDIVGAAFPLMFQPMIDGRLYTRYPTDEYHAATKGYVDEKTKLYRHEITTTDLQRKLIVINNSDAKITKFTDLINGNYISMSVKVDNNAVTPAVAVNVYKGDNSTITGIQVRYYYDITNMSFGTYLDSKLSSDTVTEL